MNNQMILQWSLTAIAAAIVFLIVSMVLARLRNEIAIGVINNIFAFLGWALGALMDLVAWVAKSLAQLQAWALHGMRQAWIRIDEHEIAQNLSALDVLSAAFFFALFLVLLGADAYFAAIRIPELLGATPPNLNPDLFTPVTVSYWVTVIVVIVASCADVWGLTHLLPPYVGAKAESTRKAMRIGALVALGLLILGGALQGLYSYELSSGQPIPIVDAFLNIMFFILGFIATGAVGIAVGYEFLAFLVMIPSILVLAPNILGLLLRIPTMMLDRAAALLVSVYDGVAALGYSLWNWISQITERRPWHVGPMPEFVNRPHVAQISDGED